MHFVYILQSKMTGRWYVGSTDDPVRRLGEHNAGKHRSTKGHRPYELIYTERYETKSDAIKRERLIKKSGRIRKELKQQLMAPSSIG